MREREGLSGHGLLFCGGVFGGVVEEDLCAREGLSAWVLFLCDGVLRWFGGVSGGEWVRRRGWELLSSYPLVVDDFDDGGQLVAVCAGGDEADAADLDLSPYGRDDLGVAHCACC